MMITILLSIMLLISPAVYAEDIQPGNEAPGFRLISVDGEVVDLSDYADKILVTTYWKTGHNRSTLALKDMQSLSGKYSKKGVSFIGITADADKKDDIKKVLKTNEIKFPILLDKQRTVYSNYQIRVYPTTTIIGKGSKIDSVLPGHPLTYLNTLEGYIRLALGEITKEEMTTILTPANALQDEASLEAERNYNLALKFANSMLIDQSINTVKRSISAKPDLAKSHILLGFLLLENDEADLALESFNNALKIEPESNDVKTGIGEVHILKGDYDKAIDILKSATVANPYAQMAYYKLGRAYELKGEDQMSMQMYKKSVQKILKKKLLPSSLSKCK